MNCCWILLLLLFCGSNRSNGCGCNNCSNRNNGCNNCGCDDGCDCNDNRSGVLGCNNCNNNDCGCNDVTPFPNFGGNSGCGCDRN